MIAWISVPKLSSSSTISAASLATSVQILPIATQMSAPLRAGASLIPSPVTATTNQASLINWTILSLSSGAALEKMSELLFLMVLSN